jgi:branched-subunit amino acid transport protein
VSWLALGVFAVGSWLAKAVGPVGAGRRELPGRVAEAIGLLPVAMLAALVAVQTVGGDRTLVLDARLAGVAAAGVALWLRAPLLVVVGTAMVVAAGLRALG